MVTLMNSELAANTTRTVTRSRIRLTGATETFDSLETVVQVLAVRLGVTPRRVTYRYDTGKWLFAVDGQEIASATGELETRDEQMPFTWYMNGAAYFPLEVDHAGVVHQLTGQVGHAASQLVAQYRSDR